MPIKSRHIHIYVIAACLVAVAIDLAMALSMDRQSLLTTTISDLAAGDYASAQDFGLILVAIGITLTGLAIWRSGSGGWPDGVAAALFAIAGPLIVLISLYEAYSKASPQSPVIHYWIVGAIGLSISIALGLLAWVRGNAHPLFRWTTGISAIIFLAAGAATFGVSNEIIGLVERFAAVSLVLWLIGFHSVRLASRD